MQNCVWMKTVVIVLCNLFALMIVVLLLLLYNYVLVLVCLFRLHFCFSQDTSTARIALGRRLIATETCKIVAQGCSLCQCGHTALTEQ